MIIWATITIQDPSFYPQIIMRLIKKIKYPPIIILTIIAIRRYNNKTDSINIDEKMNLLKKILKSCFPNLSWSYMIIGFSGNMNT